MKRTYYIFFGLMLAIIALPVFAHLDTLPIQLWDEARLAVNAYEMSRHHNIVVTTFDYAPDMWNTKPPLMIWLIVLSMKVLGYTELAVRLPSALAAVATFCMWFWMLGKKMQQPVLALLGSIVLVTSAGYLDLHAVRTGDYDSLLAMCISGYAIFYFLYLLDNNKRYLLIFFLFVTASVMTKGIAGLMMLPGLFIYTVIEGKLSMVLKAKQTYLGILFFIVVAGSYYIIREYNNTGYLDAVMLNELGGRYIATNEEHQENPQFYFRILSDEHYAMWFVFVPLGVLAAYTFDNKFKKLALYLFTCCITFLIVISAAGTKLYWYAVPLYPLMSVLAAFTVYYIYKHISTITEKRTRIFLYIVFVLAMYIPYDRALDRSLSAEPVKWGAENHWAAVFMKEALGGKHDINNYIFLPDVINAQNIRYYEKLMEDKYHLKTKEINELQPGDKFMMFDPQYVKKVNDMYKLKVLNNSYVMGRYEVLGLKSTDSTSKTP